VFLGTGGGAGRIDRGMPAIYVEDWMGRRILLDAGEGAQFALMRIGVHPSSLDVVAVTHGHADHFNGLLGILATASMQGRKPLVLAPPKLARALSSIAVTASSYETQGFSIRCVEACHTEEACMWLLEWVKPPRIDPAKLAELGLSGPAIGELLRRGEARIGDRVVKLSDVAGGERRLRMLYTGDTAPCPTMRSVKADVVIHEATFLDDVPREEAHAQGHSTLVDAAEDAAAMGARVLVITHISARYGDATSSVLGRLREVFKGEVFVPRDGDALLLNL